MLHYLLVLTFSFFCIFANIPNSHKIKTITYADGQTETFVYNALGQTTQTTMTIGTESLTTQYNYHNTLGRLTKEIQPSGAILEYAYDSVGNFSSFPSVLGGNA